MSVTKIVKSQKFIDYYARIKSSGSKVTERI